MPPVPRPARLRGAVHPIRVSGPFGLRRLLALLLSGLLIPLLLEVRPAASQPPLSLWKTRWVSEVDDVTALTVNPAGLATGRGAEALLQYDAGNGDESGLLGLFSLPFIYGGYVHKDQGTQDYDSYLLGTAVELRTINLGWTVSFNRVDSGSTRRATSHQLGMQYRPSRFVTAGFAVRNVNDPSFASAHLDRGYAAAVSGRPLGSDPERLTLTLQGDWRRSDAHGEFTFGTELRLQDGLRLKGHYTSGLNEAGLGFALDFPSTTLRSEALEMDGGEFDPAMAHSIHFHSDHRRRALPIVRSFAEVRVSGRLEDQASGFVVAGTATNSAQRVIQVLKSARDDHDVAGVVVRIGALSGGFIGDVSAIHEEIREEILKVRRAGKPVVAYIEAGGGAAEIFIASAADRIVMPRLARLSGIGVSVEILRLRSAFAELGIDWDAATAGEYKSTFQTTFTDSTTAAQRAELESLVEAAYAVLGDTLAASRRLTPAGRERVLSGARLSAQSALDVGLIDEIGWFEDARRAASRLVGSSSLPAGLRRLEGRRYWRERWTPPPAVAVILAAGDITLGRSRVNRLFGGRTLGADTIVQAIRQAMANPDVKAIVLRVDSPGGSALASDRIRQELIRARRLTGMPIIVSMGDIAASGGYWIAMDADDIVVNPLSVTGSIGVVYSKPVIARLLEKRGVQREVFKRGEFSDMNSAYRSFSEEEQRQLAEELDETYEMFIEGVANGRRLSTQQARSVAAGRVWMGSQAVHNGLADRLGTLEQAVEGAAREAGIADDYRTLWYTGQRTSLLDRLAGGIEYLKLGGLVPGSGVDEAGPSLESDD